MKHVALRRLSPGSVMDGEPEAGSGSAGRHRLTAATGAIVIGGDYRALGVVRSLGRHRIPVWVMTDEHRLSATSRFCKHSMEWPAGSDEERVTFLLGLAIERGLTGWAIIPSGDESAALISRHHRTLSRYFALTTPPWDVFRWAYDKHYTNEIAHMLDIGHPHTWYPANEVELAALDIVFPVILKPAYKVTLNNFTVAKAWQADSGQQLIERYHEAVEHAGPDAVMVQEIIPGGGETQLSYAALARDGNVVASVTARRTRQFPMDFGRASTFVESIVDDEVAAEARRLIKAMAFDGVVEVEFKRDPRDHRLKLLDVNPRVWGWHTLGRGAGVDFPYLLFRQAFAAPVEEVTGKPGVRWVRGLTDVPTVLKEIRARRIGPIQYLRTIRPRAEWSVLSFSDPGPALYEIPDTLRVAFCRERKQTETSVAPAAGHGAHDGLESPAETRDGSLKSVRLG